MFQTLNFLFTEVYNVYRTGEWYVKMNWCQTHLECGHIFMNCAEYQGRCSEMLKGESYITFVLWRVFDFKKHTDANWICRTEQSTLKSVFIILNPTCYNSKRSFFSFFAIFFIVDIQCQCLIIYLLPNLVFENVKVILGLCVAISVLVNLERYNSSLHSYSWSSQAQYTKSTNFL